MTRVSPETTPLVNAWAAQIEPLPARSREAARPTPARTLRRRETCPVDAPEVRYVKTPDALRFESRGEQRLKGVPDPWHLYAASAPDPGEVA
jgi:hypothetical protein